jgi:uncharacterized paraquat-inducible protein A
MMAKDNLLVRGENGRTSEPLIAGGILMLITGGGGGILCTIFAASIFCPKSNPKNSGGLSLP